MRTVKEIKAEISQRENEILTRKRWGQLPDYELEKCKDELRLALTADILLDRLEAICAAERDGRLVTLPDCSKCAYQQNGNISLACGNCIGGQGLDNDLFTPRAEAEKALGKEQDER